MPLIDLDAGHEELIKNSCFHFLLSIYRDSIWKNWFSRTKISFSFFTFGTLSIHKRRRCDRKMSYTNMIICRDCCPKFATGLKCLNRHRSKNIWMTRLFFCQNDSLLEESLRQKDSLVTLILFELCLLWYLAQSQILVISL